MVDDEGVREDEGGKRDKCMGNDRGDGAAIIVALLRLFLIIAFSAVAMPDDAYELSTMADDDAPLTSAPKVTLLLDDDELLVEDDDEARTSAEPPTRNADFSDGDGAAVDDVAGDEFLLSEKSAPLSPEGAEATLGRLNRNTKSSSPASLAIMLMYVERRSPLPPPLPPFLLPTPSAATGATLLVVGSRLSSSSSLSSTVGRTAKLLS